MKLRLSLVAALALLAGACSNHDQSSTTSRSATAAAAASSVASPAVGAKFAIAQGYRTRFGAAPDHGALVVYPKAPVVRRDGAYTSYLASISEAHARDAIGGTLTVPLPNGEQLRFRYARHVEHPNGDWTWIGEAPGAKGQQAIITFGDKAAFGTIGQAGEQPWRLTVQNGASWLIRTDGSQVALINNSATRPTEPDYLVPPAKVAGATHRAASSGAMTAASTTAAAASGSAANTVDLVLGYTPGFVSYYGGDSQAQTRLNNMVDITNQAYVNSGVDARVRLVKAMQVSYADNTSNDSALEALTGFKAPSTRTTPDAAFSALRAARDQYGADLVSLVRRFQTPENAGCGIAWLIGGGQSPIDSSDEFFGYSVVSDGRDADTDGKTYYCREETLAHELGHNMGAQHDRATAQGSDGTLSSDEYGRYPYSFGYKTTSTTGNFYTVMAYGDSGQTTYRIFSNPRSTFCGGLACGVDNQADNARTLAQTIPIVSQFRQTQVATAVRNPDVNGDGKSELLFRDRAADLIAYWLMNGPSFIGASTFSSPSGYELTSSGDFNNDNRLDLVWLRPSDRQLLLWTGTGSGFTAAPVGGFGEGWTLAGRGDVNADGNTDLFFRNASLGTLAYWLMNGPVFVSAANFGAPAGYEVTLTGDFNGDGRADVLWKRSTDRNLLLYSANSAGGFDVGVIGGYGADWVLVGRGDVNGDGKSDLLFRNPNSGWLAYWLMDGARFLSASAIPSPPGYELEVTGDYNGDGRIDLVWIRASDRNILMWLSTGSGFVTSPVGGFAGEWTISNVAN